MNAIEKIQNDINQWYEASAISRFMSWWKRELKSFVPQKYQDMFFPQPVRIYLTQGSDEGVQVWSNEEGTYQNNDQQTDASGEQESWWHTVQRIIKHADGRQIRVGYLLSNNEALVRKIALPQAARENLDEVIGFELDKYVPFNSDQVQLSYRIDKSTLGKEKILLDLAVIPKQKINEVLNVCSETSVQIDEIDVNMSHQDERPKALGVNLLPAEKRKSRNYFNVKLNVALSLLLIGMIYFVMHTSINNKQEKIDRLTEINSELQKQARTAKLLRKELKEVIVSSKFLKNRKTNNAPLVAILSDVTTRLPDHTYITRIKVDEESFELTGNSGNANYLVPTLDESANLFGPEIIGGVRKDPRTNKEKFTIRAALQETREDQEDGAS